VVRLRPTAVRASPLPATHPVPRVGVSTLAALAVALLFLLTGFPVGSVAAAPAPHPSATPTVVPPGADFPTFLGNIERTSSSSERLIGQGNASALHLLWNFSAGGEGVQSQPVEQAGVTYFGGRTGYEYAVDAINGTLLWHTYLGQDSNDSGCHGGLGVTSSATVNGSTLYVDGGFPYLYALNVTTGAIEWRALIGGSDTDGYYDWSSPLLYNGDAYVGISSDCDQPLVGAGLAEYSLASHTQIASFNSSVPELNGSSIWSSPSVDPATNTIFVTTGNAFTGYQSNYSESVVALNASTLAVVATWQLPPQAVTVDGDFGVTPTVFTPGSGVPMVTAANKNGVLYAFDQSNLTLVWNRTICCTNHTQIDHVSTAWGGGYIFAVGALTTIGSTVYNSSIWAIDPLTGATVWERGFSESAQGGYAVPLWVNQLLIVPDQGTLLVLNADTGTTLYQFTAPGTFEAPASESRGEIVAASDNGEVYSFDVALNVSATASPEVGAAPLAETFHLAISGGLSPYSVGWEFGDGQSSNLTDPVHTYTAIGSYPVNVTVRDLAGNVTVSHLVVTVKFGYPVTFSASGLSAGAEWSVLLNGTGRSTSSSEISFLEPNGTYSYEILPPLGFSVTPSSGNLTVSGNAFPVVIDFSFLGRFAVTFTETGLPSGTDWSVSINGSSLGATASIIVVELVNGTYAFSIAEADGLDPTPSSGSLTVNGGAIGLSIAFHSVASCTGCGGSTGTPPLTVLDETYLLLGGVVIVALIGLALLGRSRRKRKGSGQAAPRDESPSPPP
jgi:outer membrane protein assembly factor BamB